MGIPTGGDFKIPIDIPAGANLDFTVKENVVTDKNKVGYQGVNAQDIIMTEDEHGVQTYHITININVLASQPKPPKGGQELSLNEIAGNPGVAGAGGLENPWFSGSPLVAYIENFFEMLAMMRQEKQQESTFAVESMAMSLEMAKDSATLIEASAQKEASMQIVGAVMGAVQIASGVIKFAGMSKTVRTAMEKMPGSLGEKCKLWNKQASDAKNDIDGLGAKTQPLADAKAATAKKLDDFEVENGGTHKKITDDIKNLNTRLKELETQKADIEKNIAEAPPAAPGQWKPGNKDLLQRETEIDKVKTEIKAQETKLSELENHAEYKKLKDADEAAGKAINDNEMGIRQARKTLMEVDNMFEGAIGAGTSILDGAARLGEGFARHGLIIEKGHKDALKHLLDACREVRRQQMESASQSAKSVNDNIDKAISNLTQMVSKNYQSFGVTIH